MAAFSVGDQAREMEAKLDLADARREVARLPAEQSAVPLLISVEGASYKEAAEIHRAIAASVRDLGEAGRDFDFGWGPLQSDGNCSRR
jgi:DNA-directed RNA polymerase specialized sigma24 family protein